MTLDDEIVEYVRAAGSRFETSLSTHFGTYRRKQVNESVDRLLRQGALAEHVLADHTVQYSMIKMGGGRALLSGDTAVRRTVTHGDRRYLVWDDPAWPDMHQFWGEFDTKYQWVEHVVSTYVNRTKSFVDIGARIGEMTLIAAWRCGHAYAVEPDARAREFLTANVGRHPRQKAISVVDADAVGQDMLAFFESTTYPIGLVRVDASPWPGWLLSVSHYLREHDIPVLLTSVGSDDARMLAAFLAPTGLVAATRIADGTYLVASDAYVGQRT